MAVIHPVQRFNLAETLHNPHPGHERFDDQFPVAMKCNRCGKIAYGPRAFMREAMNEHWNEDCPARHTKADAPKEMRLLYPRVKE